MAHPSTTTSQDGAGGTALASFPAPAATGPGQPVQAPSQARQNRPKRQQECRYFHTKKGCRAGTSCPFLHVPKENPSPNVASTKSMQQIQNTDKTTEQPAEVLDTPSAEALQSQQRPRAAVAIDTARIVQRPKTTAEIQDPRAFQISQLKTRFTAVEEIAADGTSTLTFKMPPSDPDFPFDIVALQCVLLVPPGFSKGDNPKLGITNKEMERGFQLNVEQGFDTIWAGLANPTLLNAFRALDRQLEAVLTAPKAETIKIVANRGPPTGKPAQNLTDNAKPTPAAAAPTHAPVAASTPTPVPRPETITPQQRDQARARRQTETEILEHRLGRNPQFAKEGDGTIFTIPIEPRKRGDLPVSLQSIKAVRLFVPEAYNVEPCSIELLGVEGDAARNVEMAFDKMVVASPAASLLAQINILAQNMHQMAQEVPQVTEKLPSPPSVAQPVEVLATPNESQPASNLPKGVSTDGEDRTHIQFIPRPPEWSARSSTGREETSEDSDSSYISSDENEEDDHVDHTKAEEEAGDTTSSIPREKGILISFPLMELHNVELLELALPSITVKCERCKDTMDIARIKNNERGDYTGLRSESCKKCAFQYSIGYRKDIMHVNSIRAGYLDLDGCTIVDLLPSPFIPTCSSCSTPYPASPGVTAVRGDSAMAICRECHLRMSFRIPEVKFLNVGTVDGKYAVARGLPMKKKAKENLGIVVGQELPKRGRCQHYSKSYRWFRFSCCSKVFPCDRCHDAISDHPIEFANRMICGYCSREQNFRPEDCGICRAPLTGRTGSGFWEGGKGTRDRSKMSRKDPRKYKRRPGTVVGSSSKK